MTLPIPQAVLTQHLVALGKTGSGKSSKLRVLVEHLLSIDAPVCIVDPKGDWWGLKSSADGKRSGFPIVIFGGEHADVPINEHSGAHVAELMATGNRSALIDLGGWMVGERTRFFIDFAATYFRFLRGARTLVLPEVHNFAPQGKILDPAAGKMLHWANRLASEGRGKGLTILADSQRPQKLHKDFLTSCETLIACKVIHKLDRDAIKDWIDGCADPSLGREVIADLAQLKKPEAWVWSPEVEFGPKRVTWPMFKTYDSFKPQAADAGKLEGWAAVDLEDVKAKLATVVEEAKANDPKALKAKIAELEHQMRGMTFTTSEDPDKAHARGFESGRISGRAEGIADTWRYLCLSITETKRQAEELLRAVTMMDETVREHPDPRPIVKPAFTNDQPAALKNLFPKVQEKNRPGTSSAGSDGNLSKAERAILTALLQCGGSATKSKVAVITGYSSSGGGFNNALGSLRTKGYILPGEPLRATGTGGKAIGKVDPLPRGDELLAHWIGQLGKAEGAALKVIYEAFPNFIEKEQIAAAAGYEATGGGFNNALGRLRTLELIEGRGAMRASEAFFP